MSLPPPIDSSFAQSYDIPILGKVARQQTGY